MEEKTTPVEVLLERAQAYTRTSIKLFKFKATDKLAELLSDMASGISILTVLALFFVNLNIGIALFIGALVGKAWLGFILVSGIYALGGGIIYLFRDRWIKRPVSNSIIKQLLKEDLSEDDQLED